MKTQSEIRDTTGNILSPGQYGYEEQLAKSKPDTAQGKAWNQTRLDELQEWYQSACRGRQEANTQVALLQAHADKLAFALRQCAYAADTNKAIRQAKAALAAWEKAKQ